MAINRLSTELEEMMRKGLLLAVLCMALGIATANSEEIKEQKDWKKGGIVAKTGSGQCLYKPFVQVGITDDDPDSGEPQILGFEPGNVQISHIDGKVIWERNLQKKFVVRGMPASGCMEKCPMFDE